MKIYRAPLLAIAAAALLWPAGVRSSDRDLENDPYVQLYKVRLEFAKAQKLRQVARVAYERERMLRNAKLRETNAVSVQEYQESVATFEMNSALVQELDVRIKEADALLTLCRFRIESGKEMPIFPVSSNNLDNPFIPSR